MPDDDGYDGETPKVDAVISVASAEVTFWKRLAIRTVLGAFAAVAALAIIGAICLTIVLGRFDRQGETLSNVANLSTTIDCNRRLQAELNDVQGLTTQAFLSGDITYYGELQTYRQEVTNLQRNLDIGESCPHLPMRPPPTTTP